MKQIGFNHLFDVLFTSEGRNHYGSTENSLCTAKCVIPNFVSPVYQIEEVLMCFVTGQPLLDLKNSSHYRISSQERRI